MVQEQVKTDNTQIQELRTAMFDTIKNLNDPTKNLEQELKRANAISSIGNVIVNSVKVEVDFLKTTKLIASKEKRHKQLGDGK